MAARHTCYPLTHSLRHAGSTCDTAQTKREGILCITLDEQIQLRKFTDAVLDSRQAELERTQARLTDMTQRVQELERELHGLRPSLASSHVDDHNHQFKSQEDTVKPAYASFCASVWHWVQSKVAPKVFHGRPKIKATPQQAYRFTSLLRESGRACIDASQADEYHVFAAIINYLWHALFTRSFYAPLDGTEHGSMQNWLDSMSRTLAEQKGIVASRTWRSDTLLALTAQPVVKGLRLRYLDAVAEDLSFVLSPFISSGDKTKIQNSVRKDLVEPAAQFAHQMHSSPAIFSLKWPARRAWARLENYECVTLAADGQKLDFTGTTQESAVRGSVSYLFDLAPGLFVERIEAGEKLGAKAISRPHVLVLKCQGSWPKSHTSIRALWDISENGGSSRSRSR